MFPPSLAAEDQRVRGNSIDNHVHQEHTFAILVGEQYTEKHMFLCMCKGLTRFNFELGLLYWDIYLPCRKQPNREIH